MGFLIRIALFLGLVILFIPADETETKKLGPGQSLSLFDTIGFATAAYSDVEGFCGRNPQACTTGGSFAATFAAKARTGARWVYSYLSPSAATSSAVADHPEAAELTPPAPMPVATGSVRRATPAEPITSVSIVPRGSATFLPLPPPRRPS
jgi:hypothetical protein